MNAVTNGLIASDEALLRNPIVGNSCRCAHAQSEATLSKDRATEVPKRWMKSRRRKQDGCAMWWLPKVRAPESPEPVGPPYGGSPPATEPNTDLAGNGSLPIG